MEVLQAVLSGSYAEPEHVDGSLAAAAPERHRTRGIDEARATINPSVAETATTVAVLTSSTRSLPEPGTSSMHASRPLLINPSSLPNVPGFSCESPSEARVSTAADRSWAALASSEPSPRLDKRSGSASELGGAVPCQVNLSSASHA